MNSSLSVSTDNLGPAISDPNLATADTLSNRNLLGARGVSHLVTPTSSHCASTLHASNSTPCCNNSNPSIPLTTPLVQSTAPMDASDKEERVRSWLRNGAEITNDETNTPFFET